LYIPKNIISFASKQNKMTFDKITSDGNLWAVRYDGESDNALSTVFDQWTDVLYLRSFFKQNWSDMSAFYKIKELSTAIEDTIEDSDELESLLLSFSSENDLDSLFHPLENFRITEMLLGREKARLKRNVGHSSWLRIYAIKFEQGVYIITGGAIKLILKMEEREHTRIELKKLEKVRQYLLSENIVDEDGFLDFVSTI
jgi:hypothetical protein